MIRTLASLPQTVTDPRAQVTLAANLRLDPGDRRYAGSVDRDLRRPVTIKVMEPGDDPARFVREARTAARLEHPNIVPVHEAGLTADGRPFYTSKRVEGRRLGDDLRDLLKVCDAVAYAHSCGVRHGALSPAAVTVGDFGEVLVGGWGGGAAGDDVAALAAMVPRGRPELDAIGAARYETVRELQDDLVRFLEGREVSVRRDPPVTRAVKWVRRHPATSTAAVAAALSLAALAAIVQTGASAAAREHRLAAEALLADVPAERRRAIDTLVAAADHLQFADEPTLRYEINERLGRWAMAEGNYALARAAFATCRSIDERRAAGLDRLVAEEEVREENRRAGRIRAALDDVASGFSDAKPGAPLIEDYRYEIVGFRDDQTVRLLGEALKPFETPRDRWTNDERALLEFCFEMLGRVERPGAVEPLARMMAVLQDPRLAAACGIALCNTRQPTATDALVAARKRLDPNSEAWRQILPYFARAPEPAGRAEPHSAPEYVERGILRRDRQDLDRALGDFSRAVELEPRNAAAHANLGTARYDAGDLGGAIAELSRAIELDPGDAASYKNRGSARRAAGDPAGAIEDFTKAVELNPGDAMAFSNRGNARRAMRDPEGAIADYTRAIEIDPSYVSAYVNRGVSRQETGDGVGAIADYTRALELNPRQPLARANRAAARQDAGDLPGAIEDYTRAIELDPNTVPAYYGRGVARRASGDLAGAVADWERFLALAPTHRNAAEVRGWIEAARSSDY